MPTSEPPAPGVPGRSQEKEHGGQGKVRCGIARGPHALHADRYRSGRQLPEFWLRVSLQSKEWRDPAVGSAAGGPGGRQHLVHVVRARRRPWDKVLTSFFYDYLRMIEQKYDQEQQELGAIEDAEHRTRR